ncbi:predicted protein [Sclerotinia sclerotiorum 1980 UF-70]|uniref:Uncharacterized protein n=1 Tax=Sclerotinia sclerotiorum (strain ATCC 18683 / 1980 / Ss-1) TaxID=665079 RepID=A7EK00_SCLS1|nr:predicted protein [Sclerotinia sclerotiorum 1980 UF-70]EDO03166.1 predicted protein [Sclerotinia sclerotiorum 1980 UF-70]
MGGRERDDRSQRIVSGKKGRAGIGVGDDIGEDLDDFVERLNRLDQSDEWTTLALQRCQELV